MNEMFATDNLLAITAVYRYGCRYLKITVQGNLSFVDTVSDSDGLTAVLFPILDYETIPEKYFLLRIFNCMYCFWKFFN